MSAIRMCLVRWMIRAELYDAERRIDRAHQQIAPAVAALFDRVVSARVDRLQSALELLA